MTELDETQQNKALSPGEMLEKARNNLGLSIGQVATELCMPEIKIKALEANQFALLSSDIFVRGYLRAYAKLLKLDGLQLTTAFDQYQALVNPKVVQAPSSNNVESSHRVLWRFVLGVPIFLLGLWLVSVWFFDNHSEREYVATTSATSSLSVVIDNLPINNSSSVPAMPDGINKVAQSVIVQSSDQLQSSTAAVVPTMVSSAASSTHVEINSMSSTSVKTNSSSVISTLPVKASGTQADTSKKISLDEISFSFHAESWLEVSDSRGDVLATELQSSGSHITLMGKAPFDVKLGNAPDVDIQINGKIFPITPVPGNRVLIFKVSN